MNTVKRYDEIINLTPHPIHLYQNKAFIDPAVDKPLMVLETSGIVSRAKAQTINQGVIFVKGVRITEAITFHQEVLNVPNAKPGVALLVSYHVAVRLSGRADIYVGGNFVYNDQRQKIGIRSLVKIP